MAYQPLTYRTVGLSNYGGIADGMSDAIKGFKSSATTITDQLGEMEANQEADTLAAFQNSLRGRSAEETEALINDPNQLGQFNLGLADQTAVQGVLGSAVAQARTQDTANFNYARTQEDQRDAPLLDVLRNSVLEGSTDQDEAAYKSYLDSGGTVRGASEIFAGINKEKQGNILADHESSFLQNRYDTALAEGGNADAAVGKAAEKDYIDKYVELNNGSRAGAQDSWDRAQAKEKAKYKVGEIVQGEWDKQLKTYAIEYEAETGTQKSQLDAANKLLAPDSVLSDDEIAKQLTDVLVAADGKSEDWGLSIKSLISDSWTNKYVEIGGKRISIEGVRPADFMYAAQGAADKGDEAKWYTLFVSVDGEVDEEKFKAALVQRARDRQASPNAVDKKIENAALLEKYNQRVIDKEAHFNAKRLQLENDYKADTRNGVRAFGATTPQGVANNLRNGANGVGGDISTGTPSGVLETPPAAVTVNTPEATGTVIETAPAVTPAVTPEITAVRERLSALDQAALDNPYTPPTEIPAEIGTGIEQSVKDVSDLANTLDENSSPEEVAAVRDQGNKLISDYVGVVGTDAIKNSLRKDGNETLTRADLLRIATDILSVEDSPIKDLRGGRALVEDKPTVDYVVSELSEMVGEVVSTQRAEAKSASDAENKRKALVEQVKNSDRTAGRTERAGILSEGNTRIERENTLNSLRGSRRNPNGLTIEQEVQNERRAAQEALLTNAQNQGGEQSFFSGIFPTSRADQDAATLSNAGLGQYNPEGTAIPTETKSAGVQRAEDLAKMRQLGEIPQQPADDLINGSSGDTGPIDNLSVKATTSRRAKEITGEEGNLLDGAKPDPGNGASNISAGLPYKTKRIKDHIGKLFNKIDAASINITGKLTAAQSTKLTESVVKQTEGELKGYLNNWGKLSTLVQDVLVDKTYNKGLTKLDEKSKKFVDAIRSNNLPLALSEMSDKSPRDKRNIKKMKQAILESGVDTALESGVNNITD